MKALPFALALLLGAGDEDSGSRAPAEARFEAPAPAGGTARLVVTLSVAEGWHIYGPGDPYEGQAVAFSVKSGGEGLEFGPFVPNRPPKPHKYEFEDEPRMEYEGAVTFSSGVRIPAGTAAGERTVSGVATVNACDANVCLATGDAAWSAKLVVTAGGAPPPPRLPDSSDRVKVGISGGPALKRVEIPLEIEDGWHIYGPGDAEKQDTVVRVTKVPEGVTVGAFTPDREPETHQGEFDTGPRKEFRGTVTYAAPVTTDRIGTIEVEGEVVVAACNAEGCLPLGKVPFRVIVMGNKRNLKLQPAVALPPPAPAAPKDEGISLAFLLAAAGAGLLTILTPCVFPMLPLTISLLTKSAEKEPGRVVPNALSYGAGMFLSLAGLGLFLTLVLNQAPTALTQTAWFNLAIFAFLMYLALSLFGAYDIQLPAFLTNWSQGKAGTGGGAGLFFMGMTLAFTSFACAAPFAGALLVRAREHLAEGVVGMGVYAATFSTPFVVLALFPGALRKLPRSGGWLNAVKVVMGFIEVAAAFKFLRGADLYLQWGIFSRSVVLSVWIACCLGAALYLLGFIVLPHDTKPESIGVVRLMFALAFLASAFVLVPGVFRRPLNPYVDAFVLDSDDEPLIPWTASAGGGKPADGLEWIHDDLDRGLALARETNRPVFVDFTGVT